MGCIDFYIYQQGLFEVCEVIVVVYVWWGVFDVYLDWVFVGNGVSELIDLLLCVLFNFGDEVLVFLFDYLLWLVVIIFNDGCLVYYCCVLENGFQLDLVEIELLVFLCICVIVLINFNNFSGVSYFKVLLECIVVIVVKYNLLLMVDEIYDQILYDGVEFYVVVLLVGEYLCIIFSGLSKVYCVCGWWVGWVMLFGVVEWLGEFCVVMDLFSVLCLCVNVFGQYVIDVVVNGLDIILVLCVLGGCLYEICCVVIEVCYVSEYLLLVVLVGVLYVFLVVVGLVVCSFDDYDFVLELMNEEGVLVVLGFSFNVFYCYYFCVILLFELEVMCDVFGCIDCVLVCCVEVNIKVVFFKLCSVVV